MFCRRVEAALPPQLVKGDGEDRDGHEHDGHGGVEDVCVEANAPVEAVPDGLARTARGTRHSSQC